MDTYTSDSVKAQKPLRTFELQELFSQLLVREAACAKLLKESQAETVSVDVVTVWKGICKSKGPEDEQGVVLILNILFTITLAQNTIVEMQLKAQHSISLETSFYDVRRNETARQRRQDLEKRTK